MSAIFKREFKSYFTTPIGYIVLAVMMIVHGWAFADVYEAGSPDISYVFTSFLSTLIVFILIPPILTMRSMSEDRRQKVDQVLITSPVSLYSIVLGKFFAILAIFMMGYSMTLVFQIIIAFQGVTVNWLIYIGNVLGVALIGSALIALGIFISSLTESQLVSVVVSVAVASLLSMMDSFASTINVRWVTKVVEWISFTGRYYTFCEGILDYSNAVFFLGFAAIFIFLTVRVLDKRRYS
ncbi:MAG: ABC transporter [Clostridia bacterium]|nr:ABC transporter [Clostridia bacterium]